MIVGCACATAAFALVCLQVHSVFVHSTRLKCRHLKLWFYLFLLASLQPSRPWSIARFFKGKLTGFGAGLSWQYLNSRKSPLAYSPTLDQSEACHFCVPWMSPFQSCTRTLFLFPCLVLEVLCLPKTPAWTKLAEESNWAVWDLGSIGHTCCIPEKDKYKCTGLCAETPAAFELEHLYVLTAKSSSRVRLFLQSQSGSSDFVIASLLGHLIREHLAHLKLKLISAVHLMRTGFQSLLKTCQRKAQDS